MHIEKLILYKNFFDAVLSFFQSTKAYSSIVMNFNGIIAFKNLSLLFKAALPIFFTDSVTYIQKKFYTRISEISINDLHSSKTDDPIETNEFEDVPISISK